MGERPRFLADEMLGTLARWLRIAGYDTLYARDLADGEVLALARSEGRYLLTRDRQLAARAGERGLLITAADLDGQLAQVVASYRLDLEQSLTRCTLCNGPLREASPEEVAARVPERVRSSHGEFYVCQHCGQVYWKGSHWDRMGERLARLRAGSSPR